MGLLKDFRKNIMAPMGRPNSFMGIGRRFGNQMDQQQRSSILPKQPQSREEYNQMAQEGSLFGGQLNPAPMDPSGTFQMGFGNMVPDAQTLAQLEPYYRIPFGMFR